jgi:hypothetical protein
MGVNDSRGNSRDSRGLPLLEGAGGDDAIEAELAGLAFIQIVAI